MDKETALRIDMLDMATTELEQFEDDTPLGSPSWELHLYEAQYAFMRQTLQALHQFTLTANEMIGILRQPNFLAYCWTVWLETEGSVQEVLETAAERLSFEGGARGTY